MANRFFSLWHYVVICSNNNNHQVGYLCSTCTHCGKCLVTRCVQESDFLPTFHFYTVCANVLGNPARFISSYISFSDIVKQRGFTVINMTHYCYNWSASYQIIRVVVWLVDCFFDISGDKFNGISKFLRHD